MADNDSDPEISISTSGDMTRDGMSMEASRGITDEQSDSSSSLLSANDTTPTNSADTTPTNSIPVCISNITIVPCDQNVIFNSNSDTEIIDVLSLVSDNKTCKRSERSSKSLSNKDKCPCSTSDTASWKPKCSKCKQTW